MDITAYIPQRAPFIMVDHLVKATPEIFETEFLVKHDNIFLENGRLREFALIENIAQSSAIGLAVTQSFKGARPKDGFLAAVSKLKLNDLPGAGETVFTTVKLLAKIEHMYLLKGENRVNGRLLMACEVKLAGI